MYARKKRKERHMIRKKSASTVVNECINKGYKHCVCPARCSPDTHGAIFCNSRISSIVLFSLFDTHTLSILVELCVEITKMYHSIYKVPAVIAIVIELI